MIRTTISRSICRQYVFLKLSTSRLQTSSSTALNTSSLYGSLSTSVPRSQQQQSQGQEQAQAQAQAQPQSQPQHYQQQQEQLGHAAISTQQQLYTTHPVSPGSPIFLPHGTRIFNRLLSFLRAQYAARGYEEVITPLIYKRRLWQQSGHWEKFHDDMFEVKGRGARGEDVFESGVAEIGQEEPYGLKPMNCPAHCMVFASTKRSFKDLPIRLADFSSLHRNENSSQLTGLTRVRRFHQDDAHVFCRPIQIASEISKELQFLDTVYSVFKLHDYSLVLSTRPKNFIGDLAVWDRAEAALKSSLDASGRPWTLNEGDGAFYGPKIDIVMKDSLGRKQQTATIQLDFQLPVRFGLGYHASYPELEVQGLPTEVTGTGTDEGGSMAAPPSGLVPPVIIHRAILGSLERFMALLAEHYQGRWPFWISPRQAVVIPARSSERVYQFMRDIQAKLSGRANPFGGRAAPVSWRTFHVDVDTNERNMLNKKILFARQANYNYIIVVGERNIESGTLSVTPTHIPNAPSKEMTVDEVYQMFVELEDRYE